MKKGEGEIRIDQDEQMISESLSDRVRKYISRFQRSIVSHLWEKFEFVVSKEFTDTIRPRRWENRVVLLPQDGCRCG